MTRAGVETVLRGEVCEKVKGMDDVKAIEFAQPLPGFPEHRRYALVQVDDEGLLCELVSLEDPELRFLVATPVPFFPDYAPEVGDEVVELLGITDVAEVVLLVVLTAGASLSETTANLLAPVLVNTRTHRAAQVILDDSELPVDAPLLV